MTDLLLARHGNTFDPGQPALRVGARTDLPLVAEGRAQARRLADHLADMAPARIVAGPLARTRDFAAILAGRLGGTVALDDRLRELDYGAWEGLEDTAIAARFGRAALDAWEKRLEWPSGAGWGEGEAAVLSRIGSFLAEAARGPSPLLAVTSNGILRLIRRLIEGPPAAGEGKVRTGALCRLRREGDGWHIAAWDERPPPSPCPPDDPPQGSRTPLHVPNAPRPVAPPASADAHREEALRTVAVEAAGLRALEAALRDGLGEAFARAVDVLLGVSGRIILTGMGKSGHVARKVAATLASTGAPAHYVHPAEASHGDLGMIVRGDAILAISWSGETRELADLVAYAKRFRIPLLAITSRAGSTLARTADVALVLPPAEEACPNGLAPTTSTTMQLVLGDALAMALLRAHGFSSADFRQVHPGGKLGSQLRTVADLMHRGADVPRVAPDAPLRDAVIEMTSRRFGTTGVVDPAGRLVGIVTDGDLRRSLGHDLAATRVEAVMTRNPLTVRPGLTAAEALAIMNEAKVTVLFVTEEERPVGILHVHDLLRAGVA